MIVQDTNIIYRLHYISYSMDGAGLLYIPNFYFNDITPNDIMYRIHTKNMYVEISDKYNALDMRYVMVKVLKR